MNAFFDDSLGHTSDSGDLKSFFFKGENRNSWGKKLQLSTIFLAYILIHTSPN